MSEHLASGSVFQTFVALPVPCAQSVLTLVDEQNMKHAFYFEVHKHTATLFPSEKKLR